LWKKTLATCPLGSLRWKQSSSRPDVAVIFAKGPVAVAAAVAATRTIPIVAHDLESLPTALRHLLPDHSGSRLSTFHAGVAASRYLSVIVGSNLL